MSTVPFVAKLSKDTEVSYFALSMELFPMRIITPITYPVISIVAISKPTPNPKSAPDNLLVEHRALGYFAISAKRSKAIVPNDIYVALKNAGVTHIFGKPLHCIEIRFYPSRISQGVVYETVEELVVSMKSGITYEDLLDGTEHMENIR